MSYTINARRSILKAAQLPCGSIRVYHVPSQSLSRPSEAEAAENENVDICTSDHPEGAVDAEVARIANESTTTPDGSEATKTVPGASSDDADQARGSKV
jgi:hypothetical protein